MSYHEQKYIDMEESPFEYHYVNKNHPRYDMTSHWHDEIEIIRIIKGELYINLNNISDYHVKKGDVVFINPETIHRAKPIDCIYECIIFNPNFFATTTSCKNFIDNILNHEYMVNELITTDISEFESTVNIAFETIKEGNKSNKFTIISAIYALFGIILDKHLYTDFSLHSKIPQDKNLIKFKKTLAYIRSNYDKPITLTDMANNMEMSTRYFCSVFKNMTQKTPIEYLNEYRIEKSARKLLNSDMSITDIAYSCGFNDLSYFIKTFKRIKGITPRLYRNIN